jgi:hypothetical protein
MSRQRPKYAHATIEPVSREGFSMWFAYIHCWAMDMFSVDPSREYISSTEENQVRTRMERVLGNQGRRVQLKIDCELL